MPRSYPPEFRRKVLDLLNAGRSVAQVANDLQISEEIAVRDADLPLDAAAASTAAENIVISRSYREPTSDAVVIGRQGDDPAKVWIVLAGVVAVAWRFPDVPWTDHPSLVER